MLSAAGNTAPEMLGLQSNKDILLCERRQDASVSSSGVWDCLWRSVTTLNYGQELEELSPPMQSAVPRRSAMNANSRWDSAPAMPSLQWCPTRVIITALHSSTFTSMTGTSFGVTLHEDKLCFSRSTALHTHHISWVTPRSSAGSSTDGWVHCWLAVPG